jgi:TctA family transporter
MVQFYFLSVICNFIAGIALSSDKLNEKFPISKVFNIDLFKSNTFRIVFGIITTVTGLLKLLSSTKGDIPVAGDLIPALLGMFLGISLLVQYYQKKSDVETEAVQKLDNIFVKNQSLIGYAGILSSVLHFLIPGVLFL